VNILSELIKVSRQVLASVKDALSERIEHHQNPESETAQEANRWLQDNWKRIRDALGGSQQADADSRQSKIRDYLFSPFISIILSPSDKLDREIYAIITQVAIINAVLAGLPGKLGAGVYISMALEAWMAYEIANHVLHKDQQLQNPSEVWKYFGIIGASIVGVLWIFKHILTFAFSLFSFIPWISPMIPAEILVTDFIGILLWLGFTQVRDGRKFKDGINLQEASRRTKGVFLHQWRLLKKVLDRKNLTTVKNRVWAFLSGDLGFSPQVTQKENGELFSTVAMAYLISGQTDKLQGPLGETFIEAIRHRWSNQFSTETPVDEIAESFRNNYTDPAAIEGTINSIKGKMFEILVAQQENNDGDQWSAVMHTDETFPGSDIIFTNQQSGEQIEISLKAVSEQREGIIEHALAKYPDIPIMATDEVAALYAGDERVMSSGFSNRDLHSITEDRFDELVNQIEVNPANQYEVIVGGVVMGATAALWPFVMAYHRKRITKEQLKSVFEKVLGESSESLLLRVVGGFVFGPLFAWYLLAKGVGGLVTMAEETNLRPQTVIQLEYI